MNALDGDNLWDDTLLKPDEDQPVGKLPNRVDRLVHFMIDMTVVAVLYYIIVITWRIYLAPSNNRTLFLEEVDPRLVVIPAYILYTFLFSYGSGGKTLGNYITGYTCVSTGGSPAESGRLLVRSLCRLIPIDPISIFFRRDRKMWHDILSGTELRKRALR